MRQKVSIIVQNIVILKGLKIINIISRILTTLFILFNLAQGSLAATLAIEMSQIPKSFDRLKLDEDSSAFVTYFTSLPILKVNDAGKPVCLLCKEIPQPRYLENGEVELAFEFSDKAFWGDGREVSGVDVLASWKYQYENTNSVIAQKIARVTYNRKFPKKFKIIFKNSFFYFRELLDIFLVPDHFFRSNEISRDEVYEKPHLYPILFNGPYIVERYSENSIALAKNPYFKINKVKYDTIHVNKAHDFNAVLARIRSNEVDIFVPTKNFRADFLSTNKQADFGVLTTKSDVLYQLTFNLRNPMFKDLRVRKAIAAAIDRNGINKNIFFDTGYPTETFMGTAIEKQPQEIDKLLNSAGWVRKASKYYKRDDKVFEFDLAIAVDNETQKAMANILKKQLKKSGILMHIKPIEGERFRSEFLSKALFQDAVLFAWEMEFQHFPLEMFLSELIPRVQNSYFGQNLSGWKNKTVDSILKLVQSKKLEEIYAEINKANELVSKEIPVIPLIFAPRIILHNPKRQGFNIYSMDYSDPLDIALW